MIWMVIFLFFVFFHPLTNPIWTLVLNLGTKAATLSENLHYMRIQWLQNTLEKHKFQTVRLGTYSYILKVLCTKTSSSSHPVWTCSTGLIIIVKKKGTLNSAKYQSKKYQATSLKFRDWFSVLAVFL